MGQGLEEQTLGLEQEGFLVLSPLTPRFDVQRREGGELLGGKGRSTSGLG